MQLRSDLKTETKEGAGDGKAEVVDSPATDTVVTMSEEDDSVMNNADSTASKCEVAPV